MGRRDTAEPGTKNARDAAGVGAALQGVAAGVVRRVPRKLSLTSMSTLSTLERKGPRRITDLAVCEGVTQPSMTVLINGLERSGLVERQSDPTDKRVALVVLSAQGEEFMRAQRRVGAEAFEQLLKELKPDELATLVAAIPALTHLRELDEVQQDLANRSQ
jgi:DNA-binding MarR family transcriptional regulator